MLAWRRSEHGNGLGVYLLGGGTLGWLHQYRRLWVRYGRRADMHQAFLDIGCLFICYRCFIGSFC